MQMERLGFEPKSRVQAKPLVQCAIHSIEYCLYKDKVRAIQQLPTAFYLWIMYSFRSMTPTRNVPSPSQAEYQLKCFVCVGKSNLME